jgi:hypothetical protein
MKNLYFLLDSWKQNLKVHQVGWTCYAYNW